MVLEELYQVGTITKTMGIHGALHLVAENNCNQVIENSRALFVQQEPDYVPFIVAEIKNPTGERYVIAFEDVTCPEEAEKLSGQAVFVPKTEISADDVLLLKGIEGFEVWDNATNQSIGTVKEIVDNPAHEILSVDYHGKEILIPITETMIVAMDETKQMLQVDLPDGLLALYLEE